ncbi:hypothetical protein [Propionibacterium freudenreichii]|uniref:hypothetical protein n=1 Tax=Propionibacterium freudenreichii TaxID=1744 RepID=UPI000A5B6530|nr:hypothetical protein [Propionibacterium freudenreichii]MDK9346233.1 hypothetical protein [Propionibacterium freudenreichii]MDK9593548.1 hypothetical protein [Propionibacterium freudenreichii]MDK9642180.1 hypothetical protein [Propionibacterium freudenreichii]MDK9671495.1 hypothetical protein [Propionibacterium freudenreichii]WBF59058.1 hypothetical protein LJ113_07715 [Propionibacterium freudenreichii]
MPPTTPTRACPNASMTPMVRTSAGLPPSSRTIDSRRARRSAPIRAAAAHSTTSGAMSTAPANIASNT